LGFREEKVEAGAGASEREGNSEAEACMNAHHLLGV